MFQIYFFDFDFVSRREKILKLKLYFKNISYNNINKKRDKIFKIFLYYYFMLLFFNNVFLNFSEGSLGFSLAYHQ